MNGKMFEAYNNVLKRIENYETVMDQFDAIYAPIFNQVSSYNAEIDSHMRDAVNSYKKLLYIFTKTFDVTSAPMEISFPKTMFVCMLLKYQSLLSHYSYLIRCKASKRYVLQLNRYIFNEPKLEAIYIELKNMEQKAKELGDAFIENLEKENKK